MYFITNWRLSALSYVISFSQVIFLGAILPDNEELKRKKNDF